MLWVGLGLVAGGVASRILDESVQETLLDIVLGVIGALFAGILLYEFGNSHSTFNIFQIAVLALSSIVFIWIRNSIKTKSSP